METLATPENLAVGALVAAQVVFVIQSILILFFIVSPFMGWLLARSMKGRANVFLVVSVVMLVVIGANVGLNLALRALLTEGQMSSVAIAILSFMASLALALLIGRYVLWYVTDTHDDFARKQHEAFLKKEGMSPFDKRRMETMAQRKKK
jgi:presenilin-like A22 family membrane protease